MNIFTGSLPIIGLVWNVVDIKSNTGLQNGAYYNIYIYIYIYGGMHI